MAWTTLSSLSLVVERYLKRVAGIVRLVPAGMVVLGSGCSGGGSAGSMAMPVMAGPAAIPQSVASVVPPASESRSVRNTAAVARTSTTTQTLCVGGTEYETIQDDEFSKDTTLNYTSNLLTSTPAPNGAIWSSRANGFASDHSRNNIGTDDAYYTDPSRGFGGYNPYSFSNGALNIRAEPVPAAYANASVLDGAHWLSGLLESPAYTYGYVEISAKIPNLQGWWPAPLWLVGLAGNDGKGDGYEELDVNELFGNALPPSTVQQTQIFSQSGSPPANDVRTVVSPDPSTTYHTYSVLWTPETVRFYIDRVQRSAAFANAAHGPANAIINLSVFTAQTWAPPPASKTPESMSLQYFRWYQTKNTSCSPVAVATSEPSPTPTPAPEGSTSPTVAQNSGVIAYHTVTSFVGKFAAAPATGDTLIAYIDSDSPITAPTGWTRIDAPSHTGYFVLTGVVGKSGLVSSTSYDFGQNSGVIDLLDIKRASNAGVTEISSDPGGVWQSTYPRTLTIPKARGLLLTGWGGYSYDATGFASITDTIPTGQTEKVLSYSLNNLAASKGAYSLRITEMTSDPYEASSPFQSVGSLSASLWIFNGDVLWIAPDD